MLEETYDILKVMSKLTKKPILIKAHRFNPEFHEKIAGEKTKSKEYLVSPNERIVIDPLINAVETGERKRKEAAMIEPEAEEVKEEEVVEPEAIEDEEVKSNNPYAELTLAQLKVMAKEKGLTFSARTSKTDLLDMLVKEEV